MSLRPMDSELKRRMSPSLSLLVLASLTPQEHTVTIQDENISEIFFDDKTDLVGITVNVDTSKRAYEISSWYRERGIPVVLGGIHPSSSPDEAMNHCDAVCIGEAEDIWMTILEDSGNGGLRKSYYSDKPVTLDKYPIVDRNKVDQSAYLYSNILTTSRGCCFACDFCYNSCDYIHQCFRNRPIEQVIDEIKHLPTKQVMFIDDNFIGNPKWTNAFLNELKNLDVIWHAAVSVNIGKHPKLLDKMAATGCRSLFIGFESISPGSVESVGKHQNRISFYDKVIDEIHSRDIMINASMVFGFDHDTTDVFQNTLDWLVKNRIETITGHILTPYPGTKLFKKLDKENRITDYEPTHYNTSRVVFKPKLMTAEELYDGYLWIYRNFYSFKNIKARLPHNSRRWIPYLLFNLGYRKFGKITSIFGKQGFMRSIGRLARRLSYGIE